MRGRRNPDKIPITHALPPCRVCGEPGSGFHYGVTTCGACKGFFRRSLVRKEPYVCIQSYLCNVGPSTTRRQCCPKCRYDKCIALGMSRDACKVGRYSLVKKSTYMMEVMEHGMGTGIDDGTEIKTEYQSNNTAVAETSTADGVEIIPSQYPVHFGSPKKEEFSDVSSDYEVGHEIDSHGVSEGLSRHEEMKWNLARRQGTSQHERDICISSSTDCDDGFSYCDNISINENYDESLSMSSYLLGVNCGDNVSSKEMDPTPPRDFTPQYSSGTQPLYTLMESPGQTSFAPLLVDLDAPKTTIVTSSSNSSYFDISNFTDFSPNSIQTDPLSQHTVNVPATTTTIPYNKNPIAGTHTSLERNNVASPRYVQMNNTGLHSNYNEHLMITTQQQSVPQGQQQLPVNYHTLQHDYTPMNTTSKEQTIHPLTNQSKNWVETSYDTSGHDDYFHIIDRMNATPIPNTTISHTITNSAGNANHKYVDNQYRITKSSDRDLHVSLIDIWSDIKDGILTDRNIDNSKRQNDGVDESEIPHKKANCNQTSERKSTDQILPADSHVPLSESSYTTTSKPVVVKLNSTKPSEGVASLCDGFSFHCFERRSHAPLLKQSFELDKYMPYATQGDPKMSKIQASLSVSSVHMADYSNINETSLNSLLASSPSPELQEYVGNLDYDFSSEMDALFDRLLTAHKRYFGDKSSFMSEWNIKGALKSFWALCQLRDKVHGQMTFIDDEYFAIVDSTLGIDVDTRKEWLLKYLDSMEENLPRIITFFRSVPKFGDFTLADKITLTKSSIIPYNILTGHYGLDTSKFIVFGEEMGFACRADIVGKQFQKIQSSICLVCDELKRLWLSNEEIVVFTVLILTTPNPGDVLEEPEVVSECHKMYRKCLLNLVWKRHGLNGDDRFAKIIKVFQRLNAMRKHLMDFKQKTRTDLKHLLQDSPLWLVKEMCLGISTPPVLMDNSYRCDGRVVDDGDDKDDD